MMVFSFEADFKLAVSFTKAGGFLAGNFHRRRFPDEETYIRVMDEVRRENCAVFCSLKHPDSEIPSVLFLADALRDLGAASVGLVAPYLCYMRQDRRFQPGEAVTSKSFAKLLNASFDWMLTVDPHLHRIKNLSEIYSIPAAAVHAGPLIAAWVDSNVPSPVVIGPDEESEQWARAIAGRHPCTVLKKERLGDRSVQISGLEQLPPGHTPVLVDDMVSSARTMITAVEMIRSQGGPAPVCICVHGLFNGDAYEELQKAGAAQIVTCNTVPHVSNRIDTGPLLAEAARELLRNQGRL